ncbi:hypothetical protein F5878DRAFT_679987 [Lentinula raphanica]|uniref:Uncharacterized protein n=1 Tax=Lentinula raphanica TaxID=153919 RepID=A0AA38NUL3_9AGAR|nr:hypothetical protein F5878DRAFT_679987 [Lentinula raphanica]
MSVIEDVRLDCESDSTPRARFFRLIFDLLIVSSHAVKYEAATTLTLLTQNPAAVKESDKNVKLIVLIDLDPSVQNLNISLTVSSRTFL